MTAARAARTATVAPAATSAARAGGLLQRKCSCGAAKSALGATCDECQASALQRKIAVGVSDDPFELEADRVAAQVLQLDSQSAAPAPAPAHVDIRRVPAQAPAANAPGAPASVDRTLNGSGEPLEPTLKRDMEQRFGRDFSSVRIHAGSQASSSARDVSALAYTVGNHIVFGAGQFAPATAGGRRLLAHELTHVVQQTGAAPLPRQAPPAHARLQREPSNDAKAPAGTVVLGAAQVIPTEIFWAYVWEKGAPGEIAQIELTVRFATKERSQQYTSKWIADTSIGVLQADTGLRLRGSMRFFLYDIIRNAFDGPREMESSLVFEPYEPAFSWQQAFEPGDLAKQTQEAAQKKPKESNGALLTIIARGSLGDDPTAQGNDIPVEPPVPEAKSASADQAARDAAERAAKKDFAAVKALIKQERGANKSAARTLPDLLTLWQRQSDGAWYLNAWVFLDTSGKDKKGKAVRLKTGEKTEQLLERVRAAVDTTLTAMREAHERGRDAQMPPWALQLKRELERRLGSSKGDEVPDGMALVFQNPAPAQATPAAPQSAGAPAPQRVLLNVWVERGESTTQRNSAAVPLLEVTQPAELETYVRHLTVMLRQFERAPDMAQLTRWEISGTEQPMPPFKARILPQDLRSDKITIAGAQNKFSMELNYDEQYQSGGAGKEAADMYVASKLYSQTIFFIWRIFKVPQNLKSEDPKQPVPADWPERWEWLYKHYNPGADLSGNQITWTNTLGKPNPPPEEVRNGEISLLGQINPVVGAAEKDAVEASRDPTSRVRFNDEPGEYLVFCETRHRSWGAQDLERAPAWAFYPVRTQTKEVIVGPLVTQTTAGIDAAQQEIAALDAMLKNETTDPARRPLLEAMRTSAQAHLDVLQLKERSGLRATTDAEIHEGVVKLGLVTQLKIMLPGLIKTAKENRKNNVQPDSPSQMLQYNPQLLAMYWQLIQEQRTPEAYERELQEQVKQLGQVYQRAGKYEDRLKPDAQCIYTPEAVFVSEVDGNIYPLVLSIGQLRSIFPGETAYQVADVTTEQTKDAFRGKSGKQGDDGHVAAIDDAFDEFGTKATYGEGWIGVRMPDGAPEQCRARHHAGIKFYRSQKGVIEKVWTVLGILAAVVGVAALVATGVGAPAAAALLGAAAGLLGAAVSIHNITERQRKGTLEVDAELALDIIGILGVGEMAASAKLGRLAKTAGGFATYERIGKFIAVYRVTQEGATAVLIPLKLREDINRIKAMNLAPDVEKKLIEEAWTGALQSGLMFLGSAVGSRALRGGQRGHGPVIENDYAAIRQQAELLSLEQGGDYKSMQEKGWIDPEGKWTSSAPEIVRSGKVPDPGTPELVQVGMDGVEHVNRNPDLIQEGADGKRHAKISDDPAEQHEIVEVDAPGGIACEIHSTHGPRIPCPTGMGDAAPRKAPDEPEAQGPRDAVEPADAGDDQVVRKTSDERMERMRKAGEERAEREAKRLAAVEKEKKRIEALEKQEAAEPTQDEIKAARRTQRKAQKEDVKKTKEALQTQLDDNRHLTTQIENEIQQNKRDLKKPMPEDARRRLEAQQRELEIEKTIAREARARLNNAFIQVEITPYDRARAYSYSDAAGDIVVKRARGLDEMSLQPIVEPSIDHIVPVRDIVDMRGYEKLLPSEQRILLSLESNLVLMEKRANSSKSDQTWAQWKEGARIYGDDVAARMMTRDRTVRVEMGLKIAAMLSDRGITL